MQMVYIGHIYMRHYVAIAHSYSWGWQRHAVDLGVLLNTTGDLLLKKDEDHCYCALLLPHTCQK